MTNKISSITVLGLLTAAIVALPMLSRAEGTNAAAASGQTVQPKLKKLATLPFHGKLSAMDTNAATLTVGTLVIHVTADTKITRNGQPAALMNGVVGEPVGGAYLKTDDGKLNATVVHFGAKADKKHKVLLDAGDTK